MHKVFLYVISASRCCCCCDGKCKLERGNEDENRIGCRGRETSFRSLRWDWLSKERWSTFAQSVFVDKALWASDTLSVEDSLDYEFVNNAVLRIFELRQEASQQ